jgi:hypothetical protein
MRIVNVFLRACAHNSLRAVPITGFATCHSVGAPRQRAPSNKNKLTRPIHIEQLQGIRFRYKLICEFCDALRLNHFSPEPRRKNIPQSTSARQTKFLILLQRCCVELPSLVDTR